MSSSPSSGPPPLPRLPARDPDSHKGHFGRVLIVGGSRGMAGAAGLAGRAALRGGAGLVTVATAEACLETVAGFEPACMTIPLPADAAGRIAEAAREPLADALPKFDCVALGPGLGRSDGLARLAGWLYRDYEGPLVVDADGLNALAGNANLSQHAGPRILTPHPGEFGRLLAGDPRGASDADEEKSSVEQGVDFAARHAVTLVLKGHRTLVTDGRHRIFNTTGNPGLATGGTGDVLTGVILALLGQKLQPLSAAQLGVHVHGLAGDLAAEQFGQVSLIASDLPDFLAAALRTVSDT